MGALQATDIRLDNSVVTLWNGVAWVTLDSLLNPSGAGAPAGTGTNGQQYYDTTNKRLYLSDGVGWIILYEPRQTWTPSSASWTIGNGVWVGGYRRHGGLCTFDAVFTFGTTSAIAGVATVTLPFVSVGTPSAQMGVGYEISGEFYTGVTAAMTAGSAVLTLRVIDTAATFARFQNTSGIIPAAWVTGARIHVSGTYAMNTSYL